MKNGWLHMMVGPAGSGKSQYSRTLEEELVNRHGRDNVSRYSSDEMRKELYGSEAVQRFNNELFAHIHNLILHDVKVGKQVIFDATNVYLKDRLGLLTKIGEDAWKKAHIMAVPIETLFLWNGTRERVVPDTVIWRQLSNFSCPCYWEGFDEIEIIRPNGHISMDEQPYSSFFGFEQKSKWHNFTLDIHSRKVVEYVKPFTTNPVIITAAKWHDIGKIFCQTLDDKGNAHYYGHEGIGSYIFLCIPSLWIYNDLAVASTSSFIAHHMRPYSWKEEKTKEKYKKIMGDLFYNALLLLHEGDISAH